MSGVQTGRWPRIALGEIAVKRRGSVDPQKCPDETFELYSIPAYDVGKPEIVMGADIGSSKQVLEPDDVVISRIVPHIQRVWIVGPKTAYRQIGSGEWIAYRSKRLLPQYLRHALLSPSFHASFMSTVAGVGGSLLRARPSAVAEIEISCPPLGEQRRIAAILDKADAIRRKRRQALALADDFLRSAFLEMFGDPVTNPKKWEPSTVAKLLAKPLRNGVSPSSTGRHLAKVLTLSAITGQGFDPQSAKTGLFDLPLAASDTVQDGEFYICRGNGNPNLVGKGYFATCSMEGTAFPDTMIAAMPDPDLVTKEYFEQVWNSRFVRSQIIQAARTTNGTFKVNQTAVEGIRIPVPPRPLLEEFSRRARAVRHVAARALEGLGQADTLFASLSQRAFRGEL